MQIYVKDIKSGKTYTLEVDASCTAEDAKHALHNQEGIPANQQRLIFKGKTLKDAQVLTQAGVQHESTMHVVLRLKSSFALDVRSMTGRAVTIDIEPSEKAGTLLRMVEELLNIPIGQHTLNYNGKRLNSNHALTNYNIPDKSTLRIVMIPGHTAACRVVESGFFKHLLSETGIKDKSDQARMKEVFTEWDTGKTGTISKDELKSALESLGIPAANFEHVFALVDLNKDGVIDYSEFVAWIFGCQGVGAYLADTNDSTLEEGRVRVYGDLGTLYARCGGIFGVAGFVDRCMDKWMADATLNANAAVARWHERAQRCGFKFLVTQLLGFVSGGPQHYTGRPMALSHKHLNISGIEWASFMQIFHEACSEFALPEADVLDLAAILSSMEEDCVTFDGEAVPPNPGPAVPLGESLYARLGGVYPIALFADRLIDALIMDKRVNIPVDGAKRNEASLKYLFTEIICCATGGPEVITSTKHIETRLLIPPRKMFFVLNAAKDASDHFDDSEIRKELILCLNAVRDLLVDPDRFKPVPAALELRRDRVDELGQNTGVVLLYIPKGGVVKLDFDSTVEQLEAVNEGLKELGLTVVEKTKVKSVGEAAAGSMLSAATIAARYAAPSAFIAARKRVFGDPRTLYGRGGGVFGLAKLSDRLMDVWMGDRILNANTKVCKWHESRQKCGFKFLVTQIFGYLTGGPQRYTGQPMDAAHKHLGITEGEWDSFMAGVDKVLREFQMDHMTQQDLRAIFTSFRNQIIVQSGETAPPDPGLCRKPPSGSSVYATAGGVYPLAYFVDVLVNSALQGDKVHLPRDPRQRRTPAGLKYLVTELLCSSTGGPEIVTSRGFDDAKLGVPVEEWPAFMELVKTAAEVTWSRDVAIQQYVSTVIEDQQAEFCIGLVTEIGSSESQGRQSLLDAGFGHVEVVAALNACGNDPEKAMELLASGWTPERSNMGTATTASARPIEGRCPFATAAASRKEGTTKPAAPSNATITRNPLAGRVLGSGLQQELDELLYEDPDLLCPITLLLLQDPVIATDGCVYERSAVQELMRLKGRSPVTHQPLVGDLLDAADHKARAVAFMTERCQKLLHFVGKAQKLEKGMSHLALERARDYVSSVAEANDPSLTADFTQICQEFGASSELGSPQARIQRVLQAQVHAAKVEAESELIAGQTGNSLGKSVVFVLDCSYSMNANQRMEKAKENLLKVFDQYMEDNDKISLITFAEDVKTELELQAVGVRRENLRSSIAHACKARGFTAFYDALIAAEETLGNAQSEEPKWIVALTDGEDGDSKHSLDDALGRLKSSATQADLIIIGIQLDDKIKRPMEQLATVSETSLFIDASGNISALDDAFEEVAELICE